MLITGTSGSSSFSRSTIETDSAFFCSVVLPSMIAEDVEEVVLLSANGVLLVLPDAHLDVAFGEAAAGFGGVVYFADEFFR